LYDLDVTGFGKSNTYIFIHNEKKIGWTRAKPRHIPDNPKTGTVTTQASNQNQFLRRVVREG